MKAAKQTIIAVIVLACFVLVWQVLKDRPDRTDGEKPKLADHDHACSALVVISIAQKTYSAKTGGGGISNFATNLISLTNEVRSKISAAFDYPGHSPVPYDGYIFSLGMAMSAEDAKTNFHVFAKPAKGFKGTALVIDQSEIPKDINP